MTSPVRATLANLCRLAFATCAVSPRSASCSLRKPSMPFLPQRGGDRKETKSAAAKVAAKSAIPVKLPNLTKLKIEVLVFPTCEPVVRGC